MKIDVSSTNGRGIKKLLDSVSKDGFVKVGILSGTGKHENSDLTVAEIGFTHEFGELFFPERSFIRSTIQDKSREIKSVSSSEMKKILDGKSNTKKGLGILGAFTAGLIQEKFTVNDWQPNSLSTQKKKGSSMPLIDTGQLRSSISYRVMI